MQENHGLYRDKMLILYIINLMLIVIPWFLLWNWLMSKCDRRSMSMSQLPCIPVTLVEVVNSPSTT